MCCVLNKIERPAPLPRPRCVGDKLKPGQSLRTGDTLCSRNGVWGAILQHDSNFVLVTFMCLIHKQFFYNL